MNHSNKVRKLCVSIYVSILLAFNTSPLLAENLPTGQTVIEKLNVKWNSAFNSGNPELIAELYEQNAILSPGNGDVLIGRNAIEGLFRGFIDNGVHNHSIDIIDVYYDEKTMYQISKWNAWGHDENGQKSEFGGIFVNIFHVDKEGEWKSYLHTWNVSSNTGE